MIHIVLYEPEIPQNTGNISRTCAVTGCHLHLIEPLGFELSERSIRRAGLDYWKYLTVTQYRDWNDFKNQTRANFISAPQKGKPATAMLHIPRTKNSILCSEKKATVSLSPC